ncbi:MAG: group III truncated hemoglobin [Thioalkalivibrionaceae bacterium]
MAYRTLVPLCDRIGRERIQIVIDAFYRRLSADDRLGHHFERVSDFPAHVRRIADFWYQSLGGRLDEPPTIDMVARHAPLHLTHADLERWFEHFDATTNEFLDPAVAQDWQRLARGIASRLEQEVIRK